MKNGRDFWALLVIVLMLLASGVAQYIDQQHTNHEFRVTDQLAQRAEYRICVRQQVNSAAITLDHHGDEPIKPPLFDCTPNLIGRPAVRLTAAQTQAFLRYVRTTPSDRLP